MSTDANLIFDGGNDYDDEDVMGDDSSGGSTDFDISNFTGSGSSSDKTPTVDDLSKIDVTREQDKEIARQLAANKRIHRQAQDRARLDLKRDKEDTARHVRQQRRDSAHERQSEMTAIRSDSVNQRIQAYSVASFMGLSGYVGAALYDQMVIRPEEKKRVEDQKTYEKDVTHYQRAIDQQVIWQQRQREDAIRDMPITAVDISTIRGIPPPAPPAQNPWTSNQTPTSNPPITNYTGPTYSPPIQPPTNTSTQHNTTANNLPTQPSNNNPPTNNTPTVSTQQPTVQNPWTTNTPPPGGGGNTGNPGPLPPSPSLGPLPPIIPIKPPSTPAGASMLAGFNIVAVAAQIAQGINKSVDSAGKYTSEAFSSFVNGTATDGLSKAAKIARRSIDPLGVNLPAQIAITGFDILLSLTEDIKKAAERDLGFSPLSLTNNVQGEMAKLIQQINIAQKLDPVKAEVIQISNQLDLVWNEFKAEMFVTFAPLVIEFMKLLLPAVLFISETLPIMALPLLPALEILKAINNVLSIFIKDKMQNKLNELDASGIMKQINDFMSPKKARAQFRIPNP